MSSRKDKKCSTFAPDFRNGVRCNLLYSFDSFVKDGKKENIREQAADRV